MNTARSVAYGWVALIVAAGGSYYYAKKDLKGRKMDPSVRESRNNPGNITWEDRLKDFEQSSQSASNAQHNTTSTSSRPERPASRNHAKDVKMDSKPTGVDTSESSAGARRER